MSHGVKNISLGYGVWASLMLFLNQENPNQEYQNIVLQIVKVSFSLSWCKSISQLSTFSQNCRDKNGIKMSSVNAQGIFLYIPFKQVVLTV